MSSWFKALSFACCAIGSVVGQSDSDPLAARVRVLRDGPTIVESGVAGSSAVARIVGSTTVVSLPMQQVGLALKISQTPCTYLFGGTTFSAPGASRVGVFALLEVVGQSLSVTQSQNHGAFWPAAGARIGSEVFVLDGKSRTVVSQFVTGASLPQVGTWQLIANQSTIPALGVPGNITESEFEQFGAGLNLILPRGRSPIYRIVGGLSPSVTYQGDGSRFDDFSKASAIFGFTVLTPPGSSTMVVSDDISGSTIASVVCQPQSWTPVSGLTAVKTAPGRKLKVGFPGLPRHSLKIKPNMRYGLPLGTTSLALGRGGYTDEAVDNDMFAVFVDAKPTSPSSPLLILISYAFRDSSGVDPVIEGLGPNGEQAFLVGQATQSFVLNTVDVMDSVGIRPGFATSSAHVGSVLLVQAVVVDGQETGVSDVFTVTFSEATSSQSASSQSASSFGVSAGFPSAMAPTPLIRKALKRALQDLQNH